MSAPCVVRREQRPVASGAAGRRPKYKRLVIGYPRGVTAVASLSHAPVRQVVRQIVREARRRVLKLLDGGRTKTVALDRGHSKKRPPGVDPDGHRYCSLDRKPCQVKKVMA